MLKRLACMLLLLFSLVSLTGCADGESVYDHFEKYEISDDDLKLISEGKMTYEYDRGDFESLGAYLKYMAASVMSAGSGLIKQYAVPVVVVSACIGIVMFLLAKKSIQIRRVALLVFIIGIPAFILLAVYGSALLADMF